ncbi:MAG: GFA family protein [Sphingomonas sp.]
MTERPLTERLASCACGHLAVHCEGEPRNVSMCHCSDCQRRTGSLFSVAAFFDRGAVTLVRGMTQSFTRNAASGKRVAFHFCPDCGSSVFWESERLPHLIGVAVGAFADPGFPMPEQAAFTAEKHHWLDLPDGMKTWPGPPPADMPRD